MEVLPSIGLHETPLIASLKEVEGHWHRSFGVSLVRTRRPKGVEGLRRRLLWSVTSGGAVLLACRLMATARSLSGKGVMKVSLASRVGLA